MRGDGEGPAARTRPRRVLVAGMGNALRRDDGFGVAVAEALAGRRLPAEVTLIEVGIGGMHLVQELLEGYDALVVVDAVDRGAEPGTVFLLRPEVPDLDPLPPDLRRELLADMHYTVPSRAFLMAKALGALPGEVWLVGCQPGAPDELGLELTEPVRRAVPVAASRVEELVRGLCRDDAPRRDGPLPWHPGRPAGPPPGRPA